MQTFTAELHEADPIITIEVPASEDTDIAFINGKAVPTIIEVELSEEWEPAVYAAALAEAGWEVVTEFDRTTLEATVRRAQNA